MKRLSTFLAVMLCAITTIFADLPFRNHRYDAFKVLPVTSEHIVFIGNSITNMHEWWEAFDDHNVINRGVSGAITDEALDNIEAIVAGKPKKVFIMLGTNDLGTQGICTTEHVLQNVTLMVDRFQKVSPETEIYIQSILPSGHLGSGGTRTPERLEATNVALKALCQERDITYIDLWDDLQDVTTNANGMSYDKLHLTANAYKIWCDKIAPYVTGDENATSVYTEAAQADGGLGGAYGMRATVFSKLPVDNDDILIIGDEMIHGGEWHELLQSGRIKNRGTAWGYPGPNVADIQKMIPLILNNDAQPAQAFLYMGVGPVNGDTDLATILSNYKSTVAKILELSPNTKVTLMSLQPTNDATKNTNRVVAFNTYLKEYADESATDNIEYIDIYTDFVKNGVANTDYFSGNYLYGKGYVKVAQKIASKINEIEAGANITALTDEQANTVYTRFTNRAALGKAIVTASLLPEGDGVGQYTTTNLAGVKAQIENAYTALKENDEDAITTNATAFTTAVNEILPKINMPTYSTTEKEVWYQLYTPNRDSRYLTSNGTGEGVTGNEANNYAHSMWKFVKRTDGKLDIVNRNDNSYLSPTAANNTQLSTAATQPTNGWELSYANTTGLFIVTSGDVQLNQTQSALNYKVYNWGSGTNRDDAGCQYRVSLVENEPDELPTTSDPSVLTLTLTPGEHFANGKSTYSYHGSVTSGGWYGKLVTGTTPSLTIESTDTEANNIGWSQNRPWFKAGYTYNLTLPEGYLFTGYELTTLSTSSGYSDTYTYTTAKGTATSEAQNVNTAKTVTANGLATRTVTLTLNGTAGSANYGTLITQLVIHCKKDATIYTIDKTTGNLYHKNGSANQSWNCVWKSNATPELQFGCGTINNMNWSGNNVQLMTGSSNNSTYTLTAPAGYVITEYSFTFANNNHETALDLTMDNGAAYNTSKTAQTISGKNLKTNSVSFTLKGNNGNGIILTDFSVKVKLDVVEKPIVSTEGNEHWYYITSASTQTYCAGKVIYIDRNTGKLRFGDKVFNTDYLWSFWEKDGKLTIKNYKGEHFGTAGNGTGNSTQFGVVDEANYIYTVNDAYGFFTIKDEGVALHAQSDNKVIVRWAAAEGNASLWKFDEVDVSNATAELAYTRVEQGKISTGIGNTDQPIVRATLRVGGLEGDITFQGVKGAFVGTDKNDITNVKAYFATNARELFIDPEQEMTWREENGVQFGETVALAEDGTFTITDSKVLEPGDHYLWITYDIAESAKEGNLVDAAITSYTIDGKEIAESSGNPAHSVTIFLSEGAVLMPMDKGSLYYRIPAITVTKDGKRLVTLTDDRKNHNADLPSHCYLVAQYSEDNGRTWSDPITVAGTAETGGNYGHGDASIVTNRDNGEIVGIMTSAGTYGHGFFAGTSEQPPRWKTITSRDGGLTWEAPVDHTDDLFGANCDNPDTKTWKSGFSGSGAALQKRDGTLVSSFVNRQADNSQHFYFFMSKDGGKNWYVSGTSGTSSADEPKTLERNNGDLAISVRAGGYNFYNYTSNDGETWHLPAQTRFTTGISGNACDGEYMVWYSTVEGNPWNIAFQTLPNSGSRQNVSIALSTDEGATFGTPKTICPRGSAYSAAVVLPDGTLGVYYEENGLFGGYTMRFVRFSLDWASDGTYKFTEDAPFYPIKSTNPSAVEEIEKDCINSANIYDLMGRRVTNPTKGIYIVNGEKILIND